MAAPRQAAKIATALAGHGDSAEQLQKLHRLAARLAANRKGMQASLARAQAEQRLLALADLSGMSLGSNGTLSNTVAADFLGHSPIQAAVDKYAAKEGLGKREHKMHNETVYHVENILSDAVTKRHGDWQPDTPEAINAKAAHLQKQLQAEAEQDGHYGPAVEAAVAHAAAVSVLHSAAQSTGACVLAHTIWWLHPEQHALQSARAVASLAAGIQEYALQALRHLQIDTRRTQTDNAAAAAALQRQARPALHGPHQPTCEHNVYLARLQRQLGVLSGDVPLMESPTELAERLAAEAEARRQEELRLQAEAAAKAEQERQEAEARRLAGLLPFLYLAMCMR